MAQGLLNQGVANNTNDVVALFKEPAIVAGSLMLLPKK